MYRLSCDVGCTVELSDHRSEHERESVELCITSVRSSRSLHAEEGSRGHLTACHTVDTVVDEDHNDVLTAAACVDDLRCTDGSEVAVSLICEHIFIRIESLCRCSKGWSTSVSRLLPVYVKVVVCEYRAAYRADCDCLVLNAHVLDHFGNELVDCTVRTSWAVVHYIVCKNRSLLVDDVLGFLDIFYIHCVSLFQIVELLERVYDFVRSVDVSALSSVESYRTCAVYCKSYVVYHLAEVELYAHHALHLT